MRKIPLSAAFDLTQGEISTYRPKTLLVSNKTYARRAVLQSSDLSKHRGAKDWPPPSRSGRAADVRSALSATSVARCSTPISELYRAIDQICGEVDECSREFAGHAVGVEKVSTSRRGNSVAAPPAPAIPYESQRSASATTQGETEETVIYETGPKLRLVDSISAPRRGRVVAPFDTRRVTGGKGVGPLPRRDSQGLRQVHGVPQTRRGDELVLLHRVPATTDTLSRRSQPDPRSPLERPRAALPTHTCCSLARRDTERMEDTTSLPVSPVRSRFYGARQESARARPG